jgi:hypothetical protein
MRLFLAYVFYTVRCLSKSYAHIKNCKKITCKKRKKGKKEEKQKRKAQLQRVGTNVRARGFNAGLLARSQLHSEGPATSQLDQGFSWFSLVPEQMQSWYPNSTLHCMLPMQPSQW